MLIEQALGGSALRWLDALHALAPFSIPTTVGTAFVCLVLADLVFYWEHRAAHRVNVLWAAYHSTHHSAEHFDQSVGLRVSFMDFFFTPLFYLPLVLVGFHPLLVLASLSVVLAWQQWLHTEVVDRLPWLDGWLNTPSNHRVHHGRNPRYLDKNFGGILIVWDRLFGTYAPETERVEYGLVEQLGRHDPLSVHFAGLVDLVRGEGAYFDLTDGPGVDAGGQRAHSASRLGTRLHEEACWR
jgi:sterol desaturase/sphingolipid hydroxylase (fatty acid hydroxylase superfamily)